MRSRKKELDPEATGFAGTDEELARRLQEEEMLAATPRTRTRTRNPDALVASMSKSLSTSFSFKHEDPQLTIDTPARREQSKAERAEPADSPSSRQDTLTALGAVVSTAVTTARKRPAPEGKRGGGRGGRGKQRENDDVVDDDDAEQHSSKRKGEEEEAAVQEDREEVEEAAEEEEAEEQQQEEEEEEEEEKPVRKRRRRRDPVVPDTPPSNGLSSGADSGEAQQGRRQLRNSDRHVERKEEGSAEAPPAPKRPRRPRTSSGRKLPKLPMVRHGTAWYRARTVQDDGVNIMLELTGFQGSDATLLLPLDSDRLWRGSYKGKDWRYLGDGAWAPKVPQHKPPKHHRRGRGGPRTSSGGAAHGGANGSGMDSDAHSDDSSSDDERVSDKVLRDSNAMNGDLLPPSDPMGPQPPYACMGDQNWHGDDGKVEGSGRAHSAPSPRRRKSLHKPARAPMDADFPVKAKSGVMPHGVVLDLATHASMVGMFPVIPGTPPMDCCYLMSPASMGLKPLSPDEVPPPPPPEDGGDEHPACVLGEDDATELELVAAEAMMTCKVEMTRLAWRDAQSQGTRSVVDDDEDEETAAAVALLGQSAFQQNQLEEGYAEPDLVMVSPAKRGAGRGRGGGAHRRNGTAAALGSRRRGPKVTIAARNSLGTFRALLGALGELEQPARQAALALARTQLHRVLAVPSEVLQAAELLSVPVPTPLPLFC